jgi:hypothetical protein
LRNARKERRTGDMKSKKKVKYGGRFGKLEERGPLGRSKRR